MRRLKGLLRIIFGRTAFVVLSLLIQLAVLLAAFRWLRNDLPLFYGGWILLSAVTTIYILNEDVNSSFKIAWIIPVLVVPVFGTLFYIMVQLQIYTKLIAYRLKDTARASEPYLRQDEKLMGKLESQSPGAAHLSHYMKRWGGFPTYGDTAVEHFPIGEAKFEALKRELAQARHFIFLEYFIIEKGLMWDSILEILEAKVKEGVEVRVLYDGMCSIMLLPYGYPKQLEKKGIRCKMFSPVKPVLSTHQNNRDHRKIVIIDGHTAFTGGINLADEYINVKERFGHWKDTAVMLKGPAAAGFTMMFLQMWNITEKTVEDFSPYAADPSVLAQAIPAGRSTEGYVLPFGDSPMDQERVGEQLYMDILNRAKRYVHIMMPYLILDDEMENAFCYAAKRGVEVVLIMPHIPDKQYAYLLARTYYPSLIDAGVQIYEYTPGFVHAKEFISDDERAVVGTINLDFRSLYLHFECAAYLYQNPVIQDIEADFQTTLAQCQQITRENCRCYPVLKKAAGRALRLFAPLM